MSEKLEQLELADLKTVFTETVRASFEVQKVSISSEDLERIWTAFWVRLKRRCSVVETL